MKHLNIQQIEKDFIKKGKSITKRGTFVEMSDFGLFTHQKALELSLWVLDAIERVHRLNLFLKETDKEAVNTEIFYRLLAHVLEDVEFNDTHKATYFQTVKKLYALSLPFTYIHEDTFFVPCYELDMFVLVGYHKDYTEEYSDANYQYMNDEITYTEFVNQVELNHKPKE